MTIEELEAMHARAEDALTFIRISESGSRSEEESALRTIQRFEDTARRMTPALIAVAKAAAFAQALRKRLLSALDDKDQLGIELPGVTIEILGEQCDKAYDVLDSLLAQLESA